MLLAKATDVVSLLGVPANTGSEANAKVALGIATSLIEEHIGTPLSLASYQDFLSYNYSRFRTTFGRVYYRLSAGFIDPDSFQLYQSSTTDPLRDVANGTLVDTTDYLLDPVKGILTLLDDVSVGHETCVAVYDAGFDKDSDDLVASDPPVPEWLSNAAKLVAKQVIELSPASIAGSKALMFPEVHKVTFNIRSMLLNAHVRQRMGVNWPEHSTVEAA